MINFSLRIKQLITALATLSLLNTRSNIGVGLLFSQFSASEAAYPIIDLNELNASNGVSIYGAQAGYYTGTAVSGLDDINGDNIPDILIGAYEATVANFTRAGITYLVYGSNNMPPKLNLSSLNLSTGVIFNGFATDDRTGGYSSDLGDWNGDGIPDFIFNAWTSNSYRGKAYLIYGKNHSFAANIDLSALTAEQGMTIFGTSAGDQVGISLGKIGDVNRDGIDDLLISAMGVNSGSGAFYIIFGEKNASATFNLSNINNTTGVIFLNSIVNDIMGLIISSFGDINGDGLEDFGAAGYTASPLNRSQAGKGCVIFGRNDSWPATINLENLNGITDGFLIYGDEAGSNLGNSNSIIGGLEFDINGDGFDDFILGEANANPLNRPQAGIAFLVWGHPSPYNPVMDLKYFNASMGVKIYGKAPYNGLSHVFLLGDVNGDGKKDFALCAPWAAPKNRTQAGECYVFFSQDSSFIWPAEIDLNNDSNPFWVTIQGAQPGDLAGFFASGMKDISGDGVDEILIASRGASPFNILNAGTVNIVYGSRQWSSDLTPTSATTASSIPTVSSNPISSDSQSSSIASNNQNSPSSSSSTITQAQSRPILVYAVTSDPIFINIEDGIQLTTNIISIPNLEGVDPNNVQFTLPSSHPDYFITVNGTQTDLFTYADLQGGFVNFYVDGISCSATEVNMNLQANVAGSNNSPSSVDVIFEVEENPCTNAARNVINSFLTAAAILTNAGLFRQNLKGKRTATKELNHQPIGLHMK